MGKEGGPCAVKPRPPKEGTITSRCCSDPDIFTENLTFESPPPPWQENSRVPESSASQLFAGGGGPPLPAETCWSCLNKSSAQRHSTDLQDPILPEDASLLVSMVTPMPDVCRRSSFSPAAVTITVLQDVPALVPLAPLMILTSQVSFSLIKSTQL